MSKDSFEIAVLAGDGIGRSNRRHLCRDRGGTGGWAAFIFIGMKLWQGLAITAIQARY